MGNVGKAILFVLLVFGLYAMFQDPVAAANWVRGSGDAGGGLFSAIWNALWSLLQAIGVFFNTLLGR